VLVQEADPPLVALAQHPQPSPFEVEAIEPGRTDFGNPEAARIHDLQNRTVAHVQERPPHRRQATQRRDLEHGRLIEQRLDGLELQDPRQP
jgi:hypothetical protein